MSGAAGRFPVRYPPIAIVGPTASGKTALAIAVARQVPAEVVSVDSRQAYQGLAVGTAAPTPSEQATVPHHGVGFLRPDERYGAGRFATLATTWIREIEGRARLPLLVGGTGLFLRALTHPMFREPDLDERRRDRLRDYLAAMDRNELDRWVRRLDPDLAARLEVLDRQRAARALELALLTGAGLSWWVARGQRERPPLEAMVWSMELPPELLRERIAARAEAMLASGAWQAEVTELLAAGLEGARAFDAIGYPDVAALVRGEIDEAEALERIRSATWAYARRQRTWFRHQLPEGAAVLDGSAPVEQLAQRIVEGWKAEVGGGIARPAERRRFEAFLGGRPE